MSLLNTIKDNIFVDDKIYLDRLLICDHCEYKKSIINNDICKKCGCSIKIKVKLISATCPMNKW